MPKRQAELQVRKRVEMETDREKIDKLCLDEIPINSFTPSIRRLLESCINLEYLTLNSCELVSLNGFPLLPSLITLELSGNQLSSDLRRLQPSRFITFLDLSDNQFDKISQLTALACLPELEILIVGNNPATEIPDYRQQLFAVLPSLTTIDCYDRDDQLLSSEEEQSYITDKYQSLNNLDELFREKEVVGNEREAMRSRESIEQPQQQQHKQKRNKSLQKMGTKTSNFKNNKRRKKFAEDSSSESGEQNQMINQFKRKIRKQE